MSDNEKFRDYINVGTGLYPDLENALERLTNLGNKVDELEQTIKLRDKEIQSLQNELLISDYYLVYKDLNEDYNLFADINNNILEGYKKVEKDEV